MPVWKEQAVTVGVREDGIVLEALWQAGGPRGAVIAPPHPLYGGSLDNPVVSEIAYGLHRAGVASLRFNWRGVGASQGEATADPGAAERDYRAALAQVAGTVDGALIGAGYSFGAATAVRVALADARLRALVLVAPPAQMIDTLPLERFDGPLCAIVGSDDRIAPLAPLSARFERLPNARLEVIPGVDHFFQTGGLADLAELVRTAVQ
jgi:hypothetical protein